MESPGLQNMHRNSSKKEIPHKKCAACISKIICSFQDLSCILTRLLKVLLPFKSQYYDTHHPRPRVF
jgi:hypothetical protein